jgi:hypothetical protein
MTQRLGVGGNQPMFLEASSERALPPMGVRQLRRSVAGLNDAPLPRFACSCTTKWLSFHFATANANSLPTARHAKCSRLCANRGGGSKRPYRALGVARDSSSKHGGARLFSWR